MCIPCAKWKSKYNHGVTKLYMGYGRIYPRNIWRLPGTWMRILLTQEMAPRLVFREFKTSHIAYTYVHIHLCLHIYQISYIIYHMYIYIYQMYICVHMCMCIYLYIHIHPGGPESEVVKCCFFQETIVSPRRKHNSEVRKTLKFRRLNLVIF